MIDLAGLSTAITVRTLLVKCRLLVSADVTKLRDCKVKQTLFNCCKRAKSEERRRRRSTFKCQSFVGHVMKERLNNRIDDREINNSLVFKLSRFNPY
jgi:hypothetical protein